jgi:hypothetical protein
MEITGILRNWRKSGVVFVGYVYNDVGNETYRKDYRFNDGDYIRTSLVKSISEDGKYVTTQNSMYELDPPYVK